MTEIYCWVNVMPKNNIPLGRVKVIPKNNSTRQSYELNFLIPQQKEIDMSMELVSLRIY